MTAVRQSPCKINLLLNILGKREDGFHELETVLQSVPLCDRLEFFESGKDILIDSDHPDLKSDDSNLIFRASECFRDAADIRSGIRIKHEKHIPISAGLGGGSSNAAQTLLGLNELFGQPLDAARLTELAASLGSDVNFFLQEGPALAVGRGERITPLKPFPALSGKGLLLIHPGFGVSTSWAYRNLSRYPDALNGRPGRAVSLIKRLESNDIGNATDAFYNSLEAPVLPRHPLLSIYQNFLRENGALVTMMSGSGSTTFAITANQDSAAETERRFRSRFGASAWTYTTCFA